MRFDTFQESVDRYTFYHQGGEVWPGEDNEQPGWYFWCEDECSYSGPYPSQWKAYEKLLDYCMVALGPDPYEMMSQMAAA